MKLLLVIFVCSYNYMICENISPPLNTIPNFNYTQVVECNNYLLKFMNKKKSELPVEINNMSYDHLMGKCEYYDPKKIK